MDGSIPDAQNPDELSKLEAKRLFAAYVDSHDQRVTTFRRAVAATSDLEASLDFSVESLVGCKTWFLRRYWNGVDRRARAQLPADIDRGLPYWAYFYERPVDPEMYVGADLAAAYAAEVVFRSCPGTGFTLALKNDSNLNVPTVERWSLTSHFVGSAFRQRMDPGEQEITTLLDSYRSWLQRPDYSLGIPPHVPDPFPARPRVRDTGYGYYALDNRRLRERGLDAAADLVVERVAAHPCVGFVRQSDGDPEVHVDWLSEGSLPKAVDSIWSEIIEELEISSDVLARTPEQKVMDAILDEIGSRDRSEPLRDTPAVDRDGSVLCISFDDITDLDDERDCFNGLVAEDTRFGEVESEDREYMVVEWLVRADADAAVQQLWARARDQVS